MLIAGLTGGIASGKSTVSKTLMKHNIPVIDADKIARDVVIPGSIGLNKIESSFGSSFLKDGELNRELLGELVFKDKDALKTLNGIMDSLIENEFQLYIDKYKKENAKVIVWDAAIIIENGNANKYYPIILVGCPREMQLQRLMNRNNLSEDSANARINSQMSLADKMQYADFFIDTSKTIEYSISQTEKIINFLLET